MKQEAGLSIQTLGKDLHKFKYLLYGEHANNQRIAHFHKCKVTEMEAKHRKSNLPLNIYIAENEFQLFIIQH